MGLLLGAGPAPEEPSVRQGVPVDLAAQARQGKAPSFMVYAIGGGVFFCISDWGGLVRTQSLLLLKREKGIKCKILSIKRNKEMYYVPRL